MGSHCSVEKNINFTETSIKEKEKPSLLSFHGNLTISQCLSSKTYKDYSMKIDLFKKKVNSLVKKVQLLNDFQQKRKNNSSRITRRIVNSYHKKKSLYSIEKLYDALSTVFNRITSVFGTSYGFPKQELAKLNFDLITRYLAYEDDSTSDERENENIANKIIKRINFFTEDYPFKLNKLENTIKSQKIYVFGYDNDYRVTFYIRPHHNSNERSNKFSINPDDINVHNTSSNMFNSNYNDVNSSQNKNLQSKQTKDAGNINNEYDNIKNALNNRINKDINNKKFKNKYIRQGSIFHKNKNIHNLNTEEEEDNNYIHSIRDNADITENRNSSIKKKTPYDLSLLITDTNNNNDSYQKRLLSQVENMDYIIYMFFIIETVLPTLREKFLFSDEVNIVLDLDNHHIDSEFVKMVLYYFNLMYPLLLNRLCIINFHEKVKKNVYMNKDKDDYFGDKKKINIKNEESNTNNTNSNVIHTNNEIKLLKSDVFSSIQSLNKQISEDNKFDVLVLCDSDFKLKVLKYYNSNCVPFEYGGYHLVNLSALNTNSSSINGFSKKENSSDDSSGIEKQLGDNYSNTVENLIYYDELAEYLLMNIMVKEIY